MNWSLDVQDCKLEQLLRHFTSIFLFLSNGDILSLGFTTFFQDIEYMQVLVLLYAAEMLIGTLLTMIILVVCHAIVNSAVEGILVDIEIPLQLILG